MNCNCRVFYDQDCEGIGHDEERLHQRTALFDYWVCQEIEKEENRN